MPSIKDLMIFLEDHKLVKEAPVSELSGLRVGIEANWWLKALKPDEAFIAATGGRLITLFSHLKRWRQSFDAAKIRPFFVFDGMRLHPTLAEQTEMFQSDIRPRKRHSAWEHYYKSEINDATIIFRAESNGSTLAFVREIMNYFHAERVECIRAPGYAYSQLAWFLDPRHAYVDAVHGSVELLLFGCARVITQIDMETQVYRYVELASVLEDVGMSHEQFVDACLLAGSSQTVPFGRRFPGLRGGQGGVIRAALEQVKQFRSGAAAIANFQQQRIKAQAQLPPYDLLTAFNRARQFVRHSPVLCPSGVVINMHAESVPPNVAQAIGYRWPDALYFLLAFGAIGTDVLLTLSTQYALDEAPMVDSDAYRTLTTLLRPARSETIALLLGELHSLWSQRSIQWARWFDPQNNENVDMRGVDAQLLRMRPKAVITDLKDIRKQLPASVNAADITETKSGSKPQATLSVICHLLLRDDRATVLETGAADCTLKVEEEVRATVLLKLLAARRFVNKSMEPSPWLRALAIGSEHWAEQRMILLELLRLDMLHSAHIESHVNISDDYQVEEPIRLLGRCLSLFPLRCKEEMGWAGPLDLDLMAFNASVRKMYKVLRSWLEIDLATIWMKNETTMRVARINALSASLPFLHESSVVAGTLIKYWILSDPDSIAENFFNGTYLWEDLRDMYAFWSELMLCVRLLADEKAISAERLQEFVDADAVLMENEPKDWSKNLLDQ